VTANKVSESPQTGDTSNLNLWVFSMIASAGMCAAIVYLKKKQSIDIWQRVRCKNALSIFMQNTVEEYWMEITV
jgi:LPXTG-motif cell wall-anchored protein